MRWMTDAQIALFYRICVFGRASQNILRDAPLDDNT